MIRFWLGAGLILNLADLGQGLKNKEERDEGKRWEWWAGLVLSLALGLTSTLVSHSAALQEGQQLATVVDAAHLLATGIWVGGLVQLIFAIRLARTLPDESRTALNSNLILNFSAMAAGVVGVLFMSGIYLASQHLGSWAALFKTTYGLTLVAKSALALPACAIAALNLLVIKPHITATNNDPALIQRRSRRLVLTEASFALLVVTAASFLTDLQRGRDALPQAEQAQAVFYRSTDDLRVTLTITPALWRQPQNLDVYVVDANGAPVENAREVSVRFKFLDRALGVNKVAVEPRGKGHYGLEGTFVSIGGLWEVEVVIRRPSIFDTYLTFQFQTTQEGLIRAINASPDLAGRIADWFTQGGRWLNGSLLLVGSLGWAGLALKAARRKIEFAFLLIPGLIAMSMGVIQMAEAIRGPATDAPSDPAALAWLAESDAAMNKLTSLRLLRTTRGDSEDGPVLTETMLFQAPNLFYDVLSNGSENMAEGRTYYYRRPGGPLWYAVQQIEPFVFPGFDTSQAVSARLGAIEGVNGQSAQTVTYIPYLVNKPVTFTRWIDRETRLILQEYMDAPGHHMLSIYSGYDEPVTITVPDPSEIGPTPTAITQ